MKMRFKIICFIGNSFFTFLFLYSFASGSYEKNDSSQEAWIMFTSSDSNDELCSNNDENSKNLAMMITESLEKEKQENYEVERQKYIKAKEQLKTLKIYFVPGKIDKYLIPNENDQWPPYIEHKKKTQELLLILDKFKEKYSIHAQVETIQDFINLPSPTQQETIQRNQAIDLLAEKLKIDTDKFSLLNTLIQENIIKTNDLSQYKQEKPIFNKLKRIASENNVLNKKKSEQKKSKLSKSQNFDENSFDLDEKNFDLNNNCYDVIFTVIPINYNVIDNSNKKNSFNFFPHLAQQLINFLPNVKNITVNFSLKNAFGCLFKRKEQ